MNIFSIFQVFFTCCLWPFFLAFLFHKCKESLSEIESLVLQLRRGIEGRICRMDGRMDGDRDARPALAFLHPFPFTVYGNADLFAQVAPPPFILP